MPGNPKRPGTNAGNTFTKKEIDAIVQIFDTLHRGGDPSRLLQSAPTTSLYAKFKRMKKKLDTIQQKTLLGGTDGDV